ncbi:DUF1102 domain-containing protein [Halanaeroarchaeum sulfurireducens]|uniref:Uncharacterized protein n=1 Tax=Halanaeroarchaeum sulfurireducens TaxID=1604004 RepID=A0A0F7PAD7_9EURY|nr:DUF1102 domain-containing protein [Halanaeroarchaeum sulfurireducens]AKH96609.1 hypothetical protein HLASF_0095 [Halanaeroarchaeum sulfurireducens]ALG81011.1 hypothetical protein HLASA_0095 [Halanaeroarchaeum sulfurireducens]
MIRRPSRLVVVLALVGALSLAVSTGAVSWSGADMLGDTGTDEELMMEPTSEYAYLDDDNETVIDLTRSNDALDANGVNPDARTTVDDVAALRYNGSEYATVYVTHDSDAITITNDGQPIDAVNDSVNLTPEDRTVSLDLVIDTTNTSKNTLGGTLTIHAEGSEEPESTTVAGFLDTDDDTGDDRDEAEEETEETGEKAVDEAEGTDNTEGSDEETVETDGEIEEATPESGTGTTAATTGGNVNDGSEGQTLLEEPAAISLDRLFGVVTTGVLALALIMLIRRAPV